MIAVANYRAGKRVRRVHDEWWFYDQLPQVLRLRLAASTLPWSAASILDQYRKIKKENGRIAALSIMLDRFDRWDQIQTTRTPWIPAKKGQTPEPNPCVMANVPPLVTNYFNIS